MRTLLAAAVVGVLVLVLALGMGDTATEAAEVSATSCLTTTGESQKLDEEQTGHAQRIIAIGKERGVPPRGWAVAIATAMQESKLRNLRVATDHDSLGLFQQRPSTGWGTPAQLTTPDYAINAFYGGPPPPDNAGLLDVPGWEQMPLTKAAQTVQISDFPDLYEQWTALAIDQVRAHGGVELDCAKIIDAPGSVQPAPRNPDGSWPREGCVVRPDPVGAGCVTPRTAHMNEQARAAGYPKPGNCYRPYGRGEHPKGRACDYMMSSGDAVGAEKQRGDRLADWAVANAKQLGIMYVIWYRRIWTDDGRGWHPYETIAGNNPSGWHTDHIHISMY